MKKEVLISISGMHYGDWADNEEAEVVEVITPAVYYLKNGKHYVIYDEVMEGVPGTVRNTVKITGDHIFEITKGGDVGAHMVFEKGKIHMTRYKTPYGELLMGLHTQDIQIRVQEDEIDVSIFYEMDVNEELVSECRMKVNIRSVG